MFCKHCGVKLKPDAKFCEDCGKPREIEGELQKDPTTNFHINSDSKSDEPAKKEKPILKPRTSIFSWGISNEELRYQVDNYSKLKITESYRGVAAIITFVLIGFSILLYAFGVVAPNSGTTIELIIYLILAFLIYKKGYRWAIVTVMALWTADKAIQIYDASLQGGSLISILIWWFILMPYLYKALRVENEKGKRMPIPKKFCGGCGTTLDEDSKFCMQCGRKVETPS